MSKVYGWEEAAIDPGAETSLKDNGYGPGTKFQLVDIPTRQLGDYDLSFFDDDYHQKSYVEEMEREGFHKRPVVVSEGGDLIDGFHRLCLHNSRGIPTIKAYQPITQSSVTNVTVA